MLPVPDGMSEKVFELLVTMKDDHIKSVAKCDPLIIEYAKKLVHAKCVQKKSYIKDKIRGITRFLRKARQSSGLNSLSLKDCINPLQSSLCLSAVKKLAGFDENTAEYKIPSLALKIGHSLKHMTRTMKLHAIESRGV